MKKRIVSFLMAFLMLTPLIFISASALELEACKTELKNAGFPDDYISILAPIKQKHPNWIFKALDTAKNFDDAVAGEMRSGSSTVSTDSTYWMLISKAHGTYNSNGTYSYEYIDGKHVDATALAVSYFLDPRNFIDDVRTIFQFEDNAYPDYVAEETQLDAIQKIISNTFMAGTEQKSGKTYARIILEAGFANDVNPCYLAGKILQEVGTSGSASVSGTYSGYEGYYNFFNIGAYADGGSGANVANGLKHAKEKGWDTPEKAINGGASFIGSAYIAKGQSTAYLTKFNVNPAAYNENYTHQYMSAVHDPAQSANSTYKGYNSAGTLDNVHTFLIPVYKNMPSFADTQLKLGDSSNAAIAKEPGGSSVISIRNSAYMGATKITTIANGTSVKITGRKRSTLKATDGTYLYYYQLYYPFWYQVSYSGGTGYTAFENLSFTQSLTLNVGSTKTLAYTTTPSTSNAVRFLSIDPRIASIDAKTGLVTAKGNGTTQIIAYTARGSVDYISLTVTSGSVPSRLTSSAYTINESNQIVSGITAGTSVETLISKINEKSFAAVYDGGTRVTSGILKTGMSLKIMNGSSEIRSYTIAVKGDANGDGYIKTGDAVVILRYVSGSANLTGAYAVAADANGDGGIKTGDAVTILRSIS